MPTIKQCAACERLNAYAESDRDRVCYRCKLKRTAPKQQQKVDDKSTENKTE